MTLERWLYLEKNMDAKLTPEEIQLGWHFCNEWDGLLVGPGMIEMEACICG